VFRIGTALTLALLGIVSGNVDDLRRIAGGADRPTGRRLRILFGHRALRQGKNQWEKREGLDAAAGRVRHDAISFGLVM